ncbi:natural killer cell receptor 2B4-like [Sminthopsis crassicaudata]|uniref:natural killer cell receptor 2B4-like n=1 Tax=Sminthopsis crassicaudata TaxID=9301 RepID=UPI003D69D887
MLWKAFTPLLFLVLLQNQGTPGSDMSIDVIMGSRIQLQPIWNQHYSNSTKLIWFVKLSSNKQIFRILSWGTDAKMKFESEQFKNRAHAKPDNLTLFISSAQKNDSGCYYMEITSQSGQTFKSTSFQVSVFDPVQAPEIQVTGESWNNTLCHVNLSCFVPGNSNLAYAWYRGREQIKTSGKHAHVQLYIQANTENFYSCNVSNPVSSASHTINLAQACASSDYRTTPVLFQVLCFSVIPLVILILSTLVCLCVIRKKKRKRKPAADVNNTIYAKVGRDKPRRSQVQNNCGTEQGNTIYSLIQFPVQQPFPTRVNSNSSHPDLSIYQEVQKFNRLSSKELEIFQLYS